jgi:coenzyme Q-binding protein COQ10
MFDLVADVEKYPRFLPPVRGVAGPPATMPGDNGVETLVADMTVGYKAIRETFTSRVTLDRPGFASMSSTWTGRSVS